MLHPVVVLQIDALNNLSTVVVVPFTSKLKPGKTAVTVRVHPGEGGLKLESLALCHQIRVLDVSKLQTQLGQLPPERVYEIEAVIAYVLGLPI